MAQIETARLMLRSLQASDVDVLVGLWSDPEVTHYMGGPRDSAQVRRTLEDELQAHTEDHIHFWVVVEKVSRRVVGDCGLIRKDVDGRAEIELTYVIAPDAWGKGYGTEAAAGVCDDAFGRLGVARLIALIDPENAASARVAEKIGMQLEKETLRPSGAVRRVYAMQAPRRRLS